MCQVSLDVKLTVLDTSDERCPLTVGEGENLDLVLALRSSDLDIAIGTLHSHAPDDTIRATRNLEMSVTLFH